MVSSAALLITDIKLLLFLIFNLMGLEFVKFVGGVRMTEGLTDGQNMRRIAHFFNFLNVLKNLIDVD